MNKWKFVNLCCNPLRTRTFRVISTGIMSSLLLILLSYNLAFAASQPAIANSSTFRSSVALMPGTSHAAATPLLSVSHVPASPYLIRVTCLRVIVTGYSPYPNTVSVTVKVTSSCQAQAAVTIWLTASVQTINGTSTNVTKQVSIPSQGYTQIGWDLDAGAVVCLNHVPIGHPDFYVSLTSYAAGAFVYHGTTYSTDSNTASQVVFVTNDGLYAPPC
ncbi:MAG TPA: hypothetical protein VGD98_06080 [Ktedonobacteraceae bacterium]